MKIPNLKAIKDWVRGEIPILVNNLLCTEKNKALDARQGPEIDKRLTELSSNLSDLSSRTSFPISPTDGNYIMDCNDMWPTVRHTAALYHVTTGISHAPINSHGVILAITFTTAGYGIQIYFTGYATYRRRMNGAGNWDDWIKITD